MYDMIMGGKYLRIGWSAKPDGAWEGRILEQMCRGEAAIPDGLFEFSVPENPISIRSVNAPQITKFVLYIRGRDKNRDNSILRIQPRESSDISHVAKLVSAYNQAMATIETRSEEIVVGGEYLKISWKRLPCTSREDKCYVGRVIDQTYRWEDFYPIAKKGHKWYFNPKIQTSAVGDVIVHMKSVDLPSIESISKTRILFDVRGKHVDRDDDEFQATDHEFCIINEAINKYNSNMEQYFGGYVGKECGGKYLKIMWDQRVPGRYCGVIQQQMYVRSNFNKPLKLREPDIDTNVYFSETMYKCSSICICSGRSPGVRKDENGDIILDVIREDDVSDVSASEYTFDAPEYLIPFLSEAIEQYNKYMAKELEREEEVVGGDYLKVKFTPIPNSVDWEAVILKQKHRMGSFYPPSISNSLEFVASNGYSLRSCIWPAVSQGEKLFYVRGNSTGSDYDELFVPNIMYPFMKAAIEEYNQKMLEYERTHKEKVVVGGKCLKIEFTREASPDAWDGKVLCMDVPDTIRYKNFTVHMTNGDTYTTYANLEPCQTITWAWYNRKMEPDLKGFPGTGKAFFLKLPTSALESPLFKLPASYLSGVVLLIRRYNEYVEAEIARLEKERERKSSNEEEEVTLSDIKGVFAYLEHAEAEIARSEKEKAEKEKREKEAKREEVLDRLRYAEAVYDFPADPFLLCNPEVIKYACKTWVKVCKEAKNTE